MYMMETTVPYSHHCILSLTTHTYRTIICVTIRICMLEDIKISKLIGIQEEDKDVVHQRHRKITPMHNITNVANLNTRQMPATSFPKFSQPWNGKRVILKKQKRSLPHTKRKFGRVRSTPWSKTC